MRYRDCTSVTVFPATVIVPMRCVIRPGRAVTEYLTSPLPVPFAPLLIVIHAALLAAVQPQPTAVATFTALVLANSETVTRVGETE